MPFALNDTVGLVGAIGALGTASFGLVDAMKLLPSGGISHSGYPFIERAVGRFFNGHVRSTRDPASHQIFETLHANWINGMALGDQKSAAKALIKMRLGPDTARRFADAASVDADLLLAAETSIEKDAKLADLTPAQKNELGRFELALVAILDEAYQHADQRYRNSAKVAAMCVAVALAVLGEFFLSADDAGLHLSLKDLALAVLAGLLATPLAPVSKDLASALQAGVKVAQALRR
jgi:hypothetical protein